MVLTVARVAIGCRSVELNLLRLHRWARVCVQTKEIRAEAPCNHRCDRHGRSYAHRCPWIRRSNATHVRLPSCLLPSTFCANWPVSPTCGLSCAPSPYLSVRELTQQSKIDASYRGTSCFGERCANRELLHDAYDLGLLGWTSGHYLGGAAGSTPSIISFGIFAPALDGASRDVGNSTGLHQTRSGGLRLSNCPRINSRLARGCR